MIIEASGQQVEVFNVYEDAAIRGPKSYPALVLRLLEMPTSDQLAALAGGDLSIGGITYTGYTHLADMVLTLYQMSEEAQQVEQLTAQVAQQAEMVARAQKQAAAMHTQMEQQAQLLQEAQAKVKEKQKMVDSVLATLTDDQALQNADIFPLWQMLIGKTVTAGQRIRYAEFLCRVKEDHVVEEALYPGAVGAESRYSKILPTPPHSDPPMHGDVEMWVATGIYALGAVLAEKGRVYESMKDNNWDKPSETEGTSWKYLYDL